MRHLNLIVTKHQMNLSNEGQHLDSTLQKYERHKRQGKCEELL